MISRFRGPDGQPRLRTAILAQKIVCNDPAIADDLILCGTLQQFEAGDILVRQDDTDTDLFLIVCGRVSVSVNGREVAVRSCGEHVGEMVVIDPAVRRSATLTAIEQTVVLREPEPSFSKLAESYPVLWRRIAIELGCRLRERSKFMCPPNPRPVVFIGSSRESLPVAGALEAGIKSADIVTKLWTDGVFPPGPTSIESLAKAVEESDFALLVFGPDDKILSRGVHSEGPRDNVILELGMFMGRLKRFRSLIVQPRGVDLKIPSDLLGITPLDIDLPAGADIKVAVTPACDTVRELVRKHGPI